MKNLRPDFYQIQKEFGYLQAINIFRDISGNMCEDYQLEISLCDFPYYAGDPMLKLKFEGVRDLKLGEIDGLMKVLISIKDVSDDQIEGVNLKIKDDENNLFSFFCKIFKYEVLNK